MKTFAPVLEIITLSINLFSILVLLWGVEVSGYSFFVAVFMRKTPHDRQIQIHRAKVELGGFVLLGLEILIVADIIETVINPTFDDILRLAAIVAIRTVISFFLNKEIQEAKIDVAEKNEAAAEKE